MTARSRTRGKGSGQSPARKQKLLIIKKNLNPQILFPSSTPISSVPHRVPGAEVAVAHVSVEQLERRLRLDAARRLVLVDRRAALGDEEVHELLEGSGLHHADLERAHRLVVGAAAAVDVVQPLLDGDAALG